MSFPQYPEYKDSGVEWLGALPSHWTPKPLKYVATYNDEVLSENIPNDYLIKYVEISDVDERLGITGWSEQPFSSAPSRARRVLKDGDVLISTVRTYLRAIAPVIEPPENLVGSTGFAAIRPMPGAYHSALLGYTLRAEWFVARIIARSVGVSYPAINASDLVGLSLPVPPWSEQQTIAAFLDHETARIDALIDEQKRLIELLKEKRQAVISHAVTKGLSPDVPMKDSGVEWLGEVPAHWEILRSKRFLRLVAEPAPKDNTLELLSVYTDIGVRPRKELEQKGNKASTTDGYWLVKKGDLVVNKLLAWMGAVGFSAYEGVTSPAYDILRPTRDMDPKFYHYLFRSRRAQQEFKRWSRGIMDMRLRLYFDELGRILMPFPPPEEQAKIVLYIDTLENQYDALSDAASKQIKLLMERRSALISDAVTGKIDVRSWQPSQATEQPELPMVAESRATYS